MYHILILSMLAAAIAGCAVLSQPMAVQRRAESEQLAEAERLRDREDRAGAYAAYRETATQRAGTAAGDEAAFRATQLLLAPGNPDRDYRRAAADLEAYLRSYPRGAHADEAAAWLAALKAMDPAGMAAVRAQADDLAKQLEAAGRDLRQAEADREAVLKERDALEALKQDLAIQLEALKQQHADLKQEHTALEKERDGLAKENAGLADRIEKLSREKERLAAAKAKLEQRLRDVTAVDVQMERERRRTQIK